MKYIFSIFTLFFSFAAKSQYQLNGQLFSISTFLQTISPKTIERIEIVDRVDGSVQGNIAGIIKITTIQKEGWNGNVRQNTSYNDRWGVSTDADLILCSQ